VLTLTQHVIQYSQTYDSCDCPILRRKSRTPCYGRFACVRRTRPRHCPTLSCICSLVKYIPLSHAAMQYITKPGEISKKNYKHTHWKICKFILQATRDSGCTGVTCNYGSYFVTVVILSRYTGISRGICQRNWMFLPIGLLLTQVKETDKAIKKCLALACTLVCQVGLFS